jgi:hypothetical protein
VRAVEGDSQESSDGACGDPRAGQRVVRASLRTMLKLALADAASAIPVARRESDVTRSGLRGAIVAFPSSTSP